MLSGGLSPYMMMFILMWLWRAKHCYGSSTLEVLVQPSYSSDLSPCDYHIFILLKKTLKGRRFWTIMRSELKRNWFHNLHRSLFIQGIHRVVDNWDTCSNPQGGFL
ncbi:hypothetical protein TNCV_602991 [Trichonephila clavipes]|nr:hypothetical protein TNCV_602991 [Trichonephila clavipes]